MKTNKQHYELFKKECLYWIKRFELNDLHVLFEWGNLKGDASTARQMCGNVTFGFSTTIEPFSENPSDYIKYLAKHEVLHALLGRFAIIGESRFISESEMSDEEERLVRKLVNIIK